MNDDEMVHKLNRALKQAGDLYSLDDLIKAIERGDMQGHINGNTWAVTQVHDWPRRRSLEVLFVIGELEEAKAMETVLEEWARSIGATLMTAIGRDGWDAFKTPGWKKVGVLYSKGI